jgi:hypothetical protein
MRSARRPASRSTFVCRAPLALLLMGAVQIACFKPNIADGYDGGFKCNLDAGPNHLCPENFQCDLVVQKCVRNVDAGMDRVTDASDAEVGPICFMPKPNCAATPGAGSCDPYCQTGCGCEEKCSVNTAGALTCKPLASGQRRHLMQPCQIQNVGSPSNQIDPCDPGLVCLEDSCGGGGGTGRCYQFCRNDLECTDTPGGPSNAPCNRDVGGGFKVCDVPYDDCVPLGGSANTGCMGTAITCYLSTSDPSKTICDCQFPPGLRETELCTRSRECNAGLVCVDPNGQGFKQCTRVCRLTVPTDCTVGTCRTYTEGGLSNATYGFCM